MLATRRSSWRVGIVEGVDEFRARRVSPPLVIEFRDMVLKVAPGSESACRKPVAQFLVDVQVELLFEEVEQPAHACGEEHGAHFEDDGAARFPVHVLEDRVDAVEEDVAIALDLRRETLCHPRRESYARVGPNRHAASVPTVCPQDRTAAPSARLQAAMADRQGR